MLCLRFTFSDLVLSQVIERFRSGISFGDEFVWRSSFSTCTGLLVVFSAITSVFLSLILRPTCFARKWPFTRSGHMVQNHTCWDARCTVRLTNQSNSYQSTLTCLCFGSPIVHATCVAACVILHHVTRSCKRPIESSKPEAFQTRSMKLRIRNGFLTCDAGCEDECNK